MTPTLRANRVPAGLFDGAFVRDWVGPVSMLWHIDGEEPFEAEGTIVEHFTDIDGERVRWWCPDPRIRLDNRSPVFLYLNLARPESRWQVARVMVRGVRCGGGSRCPGTDPLYALGPCPVGGEGCDGYLLRPTPTYHLLTRAESPTGHDLGDAVAAELVGCQVGRVVAGLGGVKGVLGLLNHYGERKVLIGEFVGYAVRRPYHGLGGAALSEARRRDGKRGRPWTWRVGEQHGEGAEAECVTAADRAALAHGFALQNPDGTVTCPWPELHAAGGSDV
jgi:hypothetical protein